MNGTVDGLLSHITPGARTAIVVPTASFLPDAFFKEGVGMVSGAQIFNAGLALDLLSQGARAHHLYGCCARKINLLPLTARAGLKPRRSQAAGPLPGMKF
ncbi:MAG: hypothetical protein HY796_08865 [Elusimicrobia bacterium]|nr:hypothetical protein [Elusimicrobiota bacterium]